MLGKLPTTEDTATALPMLITSSTIQEAIAKNPHVRVAIAQMSGTTAEMIAAELAHKELPGMMENPSQLEQFAGDPHVRTALTQLLRAMYTGYVYQEPNHPRSFGLVRLSEKALSLDIMGKTNTMFEGAIHQIVTGTDPEKLAPIIKGITKIGGKVLDGNKQMVWQSFDVEEGNSQPTTDYLRALTGKEFKAVFGK